MHDSSDECSLRELETLIPAAYDELRRVARRRIADMTPGSTFAPTELVNEVLIRLLERSDRKYNGQEHLLKVAALAMHNVLVDRARRRFAEKRGGQARRIEFDEDLPVAAPAQDMLSFHEACEALRARSEKHFELLLLRVYAGLSNEQVAAHVGQSTRTVERQWKFVKAVLRPFVMDAASKPA